jgi:hypothetical protein
MGFCDRISGTYITLTVYLIVDLATPCTPLYLARRPADVAYVFGCALACLCLYS